MAPVPPRVELALAPTPILKLERLSARLGVELFVKRDDMTGLLESGNKVRKLEFLAGEALAQGADTLIACGRAESNLCRAVAAVGARLGLRVRLAVADDATGDGNLLLARLLGAEIRAVPDLGEAAVSEVMEELAAETREAGGTPYVIPEGGAGEVGALGYLECAVELTGQMSHGAPRFDAVVVPAGSGGSLAGLHMGKQLVGLPSEVVGVPIGVPGDRVRERVALTVERAIRRFGFAIDVPKRIGLLEVAEAGLSPASPASLQTLVDIAAGEGLVLDPVYTAPAFGALLDVLAGDPRALGQRVCFIHTGGLFGVFPLRERLAALADRRQG